MKTKTLKSLVCLLLLIVLGGEVILSAFSVYAGATNNTVSSPLEDLKKDPNFNVDDYPLITVDYYNKVNSDQDKNNDIAFMEVIQIAESSGGELVVYVYQPTHYNLDLEATGISISLGFSKDGQDLSPKIYDLKLLSSEGVFDKYLVEDFNVPNDLHRYYNIVALYREYSSSIDAFSNGSVLENYQIGMSIGQQWYAYNENNSVVYEMVTFNTLELTIKHTGFVELGAGFKIGELVGVYDTGRVWFVAFDFEDYKAEKIFDADISYRHRSVKESQSSSNPNITKTYGDWITEDSVFLSEFGNVTYEGDGLLSRKYSWDQIMKSSDFLSSCEDQEVSLNSSAQTALNNSQYVFVFWQSETLSASEGSYRDQYWYRYDWYDEVDSLGIIRVKFLDSTGDVYNMGAVTDLVHPDNIPDGYGDGIDYNEFLEWFERIVALIGIVLVLVLCSFLSGFFSFIFNILLAFLKVLFAILKFPFKIVAKLFEFSKK